jgi:fermentation-respiration switch protein FrsA (DUF1100 family)
MRSVLALLPCLLLSSGCVKLDFFLFESEEADSVEEDYHGLPLFNGANPPQWLQGVPVEREIYLRVPSAEQILPGGEEQYIHGVFLPAPKDCPAQECPLVNESVTFLYQHGNSGHMYRYWYRAVALWNLGANVFVYTYRGYGLSKGETSRSSILQDATTAMTYIRSRPDVDPSRIIAYGYSMGAIPTSHLVGRSEHRGRFAGAILESALDAPESIVNLSTGTDFPDGMFLDNTPFDGPEFIEGSSLPILQIHGGKDERVLMKQAERYYDVLKDRPDYTHYLGKTNKPHESWIRESGHRNIPVFAFKGELHIADYYGSDDNKAHCCVHPLEYTDPAHARFLSAVGETTGQAMYESSRNYADLISGWILSLFP